MRNTNSNISNCLEEIELNTQFNRGLVIDGIFGSKTKEACITIKQGAKGNITRLIHD